MAAAVSNVEPLVSDKIFKYLLYTGVALMLVFALLPFLKRKAADVYRGSAAGSCANLSENFEEIELPACVGCWRLKIRPDAFSGQVYFPKGRKVDFDLDYENDGSPIQIRNKFGKILTVNPRINSGLGINRGNEALQFKGTGYVRIRILRVWQAGDF